MNMLEGTIMGMKVVMFTLYTSYCCFFLRLCQFRVSVCVSSDHLRKPKCTHTCHSHQHTTEEQNLPYSTFHIVMVQPYRSSRDYSQRDSKYADNAQPVLLGKVFLSDVSHHWEVDTASKFKD